MFAKSGSYVPIEVRINVFWNIFQDELVMLKSTEPVLAQVEMAQNLKRVGGRCQPHAAKVRLLLDQFSENVAAPCGTK